MYVRHVEFVGGVFEVEVEWPSAPRTAPAIAFEDFGAAITSALDAFAPTPRLDVFPRLRLGIGLEHQVESRPCETLLREDAMTL